MTAVADDGLSLVGTLTLPAGPGPHPPSCCCTAPGGWIAIPTPRASGWSSDHHWPKCWQAPGSPRCVTTGAVSAPPAAIGWRPDSPPVGTTPPPRYAPSLRDPISGRTPLACSGTARVPFTPCPLGHARRWRRWCCWPGSPAGEDALRWQAAMIARDLPAPVRPLLPILRSLANRQLARIKTTSTDVVRILGRPTNARWLRELLDHDPRADLAKIKAPVLAITGGKDIQVDPADLDEIRRLVPGDSTVHRIPDLTHVLRRDSGRPSVRSYRRLLRQPVDPDLLTQVTGWLAHRLHETPDTVRAG
ncbi:alpha/beta hydrolase [Micromonospora sp. M12]